MDEVKKKGGFWKPVMTAIIVALIAGGSSPWWWAEFFGSRDAIITDQNSAAGARVLQANGERCVLATQCESKYCYPGPGDDAVRYCLDRSLNCAYPGMDGFQYGDRVSFQGGLYECFAPDNGPASWRLLETSND